MQIVHRLRQPGQLPTARIVQSSALQQRLTPLLFSFSRWLSIVPASIGTLYNIFCAASPPQKPAGRRVDFVVSVLWVNLREVPPCSCFR